MIFFKPGVRLTGMQPQITVAIAVAHSVFARNGVPDMTVTSVIDGQHSRQSLHYVGHAFDIRMSEIGLETRVAIVADLKRCLGEEFDVILEATHIHVEWQPKR